MINSVIVVILLSAIVFGIFIRTLKRDISRYNDIEIEDTQEEFGWKMIHGDVFRSPSNRMMLSVLIGNGAQVLFMASVTLVLAALGFLSPSNRGSLLTVMLVCYVLFGSVAGYISSRIYKLCGGQAWRQNVLMTSILVPGGAFLLVLLLNILFIAQKSSSAIPFGTLFSLIALWVLLNIPLCFIGAFIGFKQQVFILFNSENISPCEDLTNPPTSSRSTTLPTIHTRSITSRFTTLWSILYRTLIHPQQHLGQQNLLRIWVFDDGFCNLNLYYFPSLNNSCIRSPLWRKLSLVKILF